MVDPSKMYTIQEVAEALSVPASTVRWWAQRDAIHGVKVGRAWRFKGSEVIRVTEEGTRPQKASGADGRHELSSDEQEAQEATA